LTALPEELFALKHLRRLNLCGRFIDEDGKWQLSSGHVAPNAVESSLGQLIELPELEALFLGGCWLESLDGIAGLKSLRVLDCTGTKASSLEPLAGLTALQTLDCSYTQVSSLKPLAGLTALQELDCPYTQVSSLKPLAGLTALQRLDCSDTKVSSLKPLAGLTALQWLNCSGCALDDFPQGLLFSSSLEDLILYGCRLPGCARRSLVSAPGKLPGGAPRSCPGSASRDRPCGRCQTDSPRQWPGRQDPALPAAAGRGL
jgi:Leucine-rich repeat (LRR) protein